MMKAIMYVVCQEIWKERRTKRRKKKKEGYKRSAGKGNVKFFVVKEGPFWGNITVNPPFLPPSMTQPSLFILWEKEAFDASML